MILFITFCVLFLYLMFKLIAFMIKATFSILSVLACIFAPILLIGLVAAGVIYLALPLVIVGIIIAAAISRA